jgi:hypothetical protein
MSRGESGRVVIEVDPELKKQLYAALALSSLTLKDWFVRNAETYCVEQLQGDLFKVGEERRDAAASRRGRA